MKYLFHLLLLFCVSEWAWAQSASIKGSIYSQDGVLAYATIIIDSSTFGAVSDSMGNYRIDGLSKGEYLLSISYLGYRSSQKKIVISNDNEIVNVDFEMQGIESKLNSLVITGTRTSKKRNQSPVMVGLIDSKTLSNTQSCNLSEGLRFQPGLRVETDCQTCNYTQLRMNGLAGGYSQILVNGRPIFSPLTGLYGLEQIPVNMIERIEVVRGGGSALYGSSAIGGTVNVITKIPVDNSYDLTYTYQSLSGSDDHIISANASVIATNMKIGSSVFLNNRRRDFYDHNSDNFSEIPEISNDAIGANVFFLPNENQKLEASISSIHEERRGGEMLDKPSHLLQQSENRIHDVILGNVDYQINFNKGNSSFIPYLALQRTKRKHYTGIFPDDSLEILIHLNNPPYGNSSSSTNQGGIQLNHRLLSFLGGNNTLTIGLEVIEDYVRDEIAAYNYFIDQRTLNTAGYFQSDWLISEHFELLAGLRIDEHNFLDHLVYSPRVSAMYKPKRDLQFRLTVGSGFRAPQAFDSDLHIAFAGGGVSRVSLSPDLKEERSKSYSASMNYDKVSEHYIAGFTLESFYTVLEDAFYSQPMGTDQFGERFEKRNGSGATVKGITLELRANYDGLYQLEGGLTLQTSLYHEAVENIQGLDPKREFLRTPNEYAYAIFTLNPNQRWSNSINLVYTGPMLHVHFSGAPEQLEDSYKTSSSFTEISFKTSYSIPFGRSKSGIEMFGGVRNITNAFQNDFDSGKNRDSNFIYGPAAPRTYFIGLKFRSF